MDKEKTVLYNIIAALAIIMGVGGCVAKDYYDDKVHDAESKLSYARDSIQHVKDSLATHQEVEQKNQVQRDVYFLDFNNILHKKSGCLEIRLAEIPVATKPVMKEMASNENLFCTKCFTEEEIASYASNIRK